VVVTISQFIKLSYGACLETFDHSGQWLLFQGLSGVMRKCLQAGKRQGTRASLCGGRACDGGWQGASLRNRRGLRKAVASPQPRQAGCGTRPRSSAHPTHTQLNLPSMHFESKSHTPECINSVGDHELLNKCAGRVSYLSPEAGFSHHNHHHVQCVDTKYEARWVNAAALPIFSIGP
jgi:hypothetical protein